MTVSGDLRDRVRFDRRAQGGDGYGNTVEGWDDGFTRWAQIKPLKGGEDVIGARLQGTQPVIIIVRFDPQTSALTTDMRAVDVRNGVTYAITSVADMERRREFITLMATAGKVA